MKMPQKFVYEVKYKLIAHKRTNKIKLLIIGFIAWLLNRLFKLKIEMQYRGEGIKVEDNP